MSNLFLRLGALFALAGVSLGYWMGMTEQFGLMPVHAHINLLGWVSMFLYGLFYRAVPAAAAFSPVWRNTITANRMKAIRVSVGPAIRPTRAAVSVPGMCSSFSASAGMNTRRPTTAVQKWAMAKSPPAAAGTAR